MRVATAALLWLFACACWPGAFKIGKGFDPKQAGADQCPDEPEDYDAFHDSDGCPEPDNDEDGIADHEDMCPNEPGVLVSPAARGCPSA
jgi:hypothetical protein